MEPIEGVSTPASRITPVDLDPSRRPGVPRERSPSPLPNASFPPERQQSAPSVPRHGRPDKPMPPVYGTAIPPRGLSGAIRILAYRYPDHWMRHWMLLLFADRVDSWELRARKLAGFAAIAGVAGIAGRRLYAMAKG